jgi:hypothetical protein
MNTVIKEAFIQGYMLKSNKTEDKKSISRDAFLKGYMHKQANEAVPLQEMIAAYNKANGAGAAEKILAGDKAYSFANNFTQGPNAARNQQIAGAGLGATAGAGLGYMMGGNATSALLGSGFGALVGWLATNYFGGDTTKAIQKIQEDRGRATLQAQQQAEAAKIAAAKAKVNEQEVKHETDKVITNPPQGQTQGQTTAVSNTPVITPSVNNTPSLIKQPTNPYNVSVPKAYA